MERVLLDSTSARPLRSRPLNAPSDTPVAEPSAPAPAAPAGRPATPPRRAVRWLAPFLVAAWADAVGCAVERPPDGRSLTVVLADAWWAHAAVGVALAVLLLPFESLVGRIRVNRPVGRVALAAALASTAALHLGHLAALRDGPFAGDVVPDALPTTVTGAVVASLALFVAARVALGVLFSLPPLGRLVDGPLGAALAGLAGLGLLAGGLATAGTERLPTSVADERLAHLDGPPNVVFIIADTLRADRLGAYGYDRHPTSPNIDAFAARSTVFEDSVSNSSWTIPGTASLWTGRWLIEHGASAQVRLLHPSLPTLPGILRDHGYRTMAVSSNSMINGRHQGYVTPFDWVQDTSFDTPVVRATRTRRAPRDPFVLREAAESLTGVPRGAPRFLPEVPANPGDLGVHETTECALQYVDMARADDRPWFLFLNYMANHRPYQFPEDWDAGFPAAPKPPAREWDPIIRAASIPEFPGIHPVYWRQLLAAEDIHPYDADDLRFLSDRYDQTVRYLDDEVGRLLAGLEERGLMRDTIVVFTSDHGESLGEHDDFGHGRILSAPLLDVPLVVYDPERAPGRVTRTVQGIDLLPTLLARLGIDAQEAAGRRLPGTDLFAERADAPVVAELHDNDSEGALDWRHGPPLADWLAQVLGGDALQREVRLMGKVQRNLPEEPDAADGTPSLKTLLARWIARVQQQPTLVADLAAIDDGDPALDKPLGPALPGLVQRDFRDYYYAARRALVTPEHLYVRTSAGEELLYDRATGTLVEDAGDAVLAALRARLDAWRESVTPFDADVSLDNASQVPYLR